MVLRDNGGKLMRAERVQFFGTDPSVVPIGGEPPGERGPGRKHGPQYAWCHGLEENREAAVDDGEACAALAHIVEEGRLLQQRAGLPVEPHHRVEHVKRMALVIDRQLQKERRQPGAQHHLSGGALLRRDPSRGMPPELADPVQGRCRHSSPSVSGRPQRSFRRSRS